MEITTLTTDLNHHQAQDDNPNDSGGLTAAQYKVVCDQGVNDIKDYLNGTHIPQLDAEHLPYIYGGTQTIKTTMETLTAGVMPDASVTPAKASTDFLYGVIGALSAITPATADKIPFLDTSGSVAGYATVENMAGALKPLLYTSGSYAGNDTNDRPITLGFQPSAVLILPYGGIYAGGSLLNLALALASVPAQNLSVTATGFTVSGPLNYSPSSPYGSDRSPYRYIALR